MQLPADVNHAAMEEQSDDCSLLLKCGVVFLLGRAAMEEQSDDCSLISLVIPPVGPNYGRNGGAVGRLLVACRVLASVRHGEGPQWRSSRTTARWPLQRGTVSSASCRNGGAVGRLLVGPLARRPHRPRARRNGGAVGRLLVVRRRINASQPRSRRNGGAVGRLLVGSLRSGRNQHRHRRNGGAVGRLLVELFGSGGCVRA